MQGTLGKEDTMIINPKKKNVFHYQKMVKDMINFTRIYNFKPLA